MIDKSLVLRLAEERIQELNRGLFIVDLTISTRNVINIELDREGGGVSIEDCISVSRNVEHNLDRESVDFELNVSSAGMDRPLRHEKQFIKNQIQNLSYSGGYFLENLGTQNLATYLLHTAYKSFACIRGNFAL